MSRRRPTIPPRTRIFLGCEGASEYGYATLLDQLLRESAKLHVTLQRAILQPGAGDPLELIKRASVVAEQLERRHGRFAHRGVLMDRGTPEKSAEATAFAQTEDLDIIWQEQGHEELLLRHLPGCGSLRPHARDALATLRDHWPEYRKAMAARDLARRIGIAGVRQACSGHASLRAFLVSIGFDANG
jgi:hypothetical protein